MRGSRDSRHALPIEGTGTRGSQTAAVALGASTGSVPSFTFNIFETIRIIEEAYDHILAHGCKPLTLGGDHTIPLPILRAMKKAHGPVGVIHVDAHADVNEHMFGEPVAHGTPFRRAIEEGHKNDRDLGANQQSDGDNDTGAQSGPAARP